MELKAWRVHLVRLWKYPSVSDWECCDADFFVGVLRSTLVCQVCQHMSETLEPFIDLSLPVNLVSSSSPDPVGYMWSAAQSNVRLYEIYCFSFIDLFNSFVWQCLVSSEMFINPENPPIYKRDWDLNIYLAVGSAVGFIYSGLGKLYMQHINELTYWNGMALILLNRFPFCLSQNNLFVLTYS